MQPRQDDYTEKYVAQQERIKAFLQKPPAGCQNWSHQKAVEYKKLVKKCEPITRLKPKSQVTEFLKVEHLADMLGRYYG